MKRTIEEHAARFDEHASAYDDDSDPVYEACKQRVIELAAPSGQDTVLDLGTGTGAVALALSKAAETVIGRDISEGMLEEARSKIQQRNITNVELDHGSFREPGYVGEPDIITSNFALHHLNDQAKREAIAFWVEEFSPQRVVLGDLMFFDEPDPEEPFYDPSVDDPATVGVLAEAFTEAGLVLRNVESLHPQVGVIRAEAPETLR